MSKIIKLSEKTKDISDNDNDDIDDSDNDNIYIVLANDEAAGFNK